MDSKKLDLLLINPGSNKRVYERLAETISAIETPFMAALTAGFARKNGFNVQLIDANADGLTIEETAQIAKDYNPHLVEIIVHGQQPSASSQLMGVVGDLCKNIKGISNIPILLSGVHPSSLPKRTLDEESCDYVARGEHFHTLLGLLQNRKLEDVQGLCFKRDGKFIANPAAPLISNLDSELSDVAWDLLGSLKKYRSHNWHAGFTDLQDRRPYASIYTSLGCPFTCSFCCINAEFRASISDSTGKKLPVFDSNFDLNAMKDITEEKPKIRYWSSEQVIKNIEYLVEKQGVKYIKIIDEMFFLNKKHVRDIADKIIERCYKVNIWAYSRVDTTKDTALLAHAKKAGIDWLCLGIESGNSLVRKGVVDKKFDNDAIIQSVQNVKNAGIKIIGNYMFGLPDDTIESMNETLALAKEIKAEWYNGYATVAYPGSPLYLAAKSKGIPLPGDKDVPGGWTAYSHHSYYFLPLPTKYISSAEVLKFRDFAFQEMMSDNGYLSVIEKNFGKSAVQHIAELNAHKIKRRILGD